MSNSIKKTAITAHPLVGQETFTVFNPSTGEAIANISDCQPQDAANALKEACHSLESWRSLDYKQRISKVESWTGLLRDHLEDIAQIACSEMGKPITEARGEVEYSIEILQQQMAAAHREFENTPTSFCYEGNLARQGVGVVLAITPWNFPIASVVVKLGAAFVSGCPVILKPAEDTPLTAIALGDLAIQGGIPQGVLQVLPCSDPTRVAPLLLDSHHIRLVSFTGSIGVGRTIMAQASPTIKRLAFELGGNAPFVVFEDADLDNAAENAMGARFYNSGQICIGANRFLVKEAILDDFISRITPKVQNLKVGLGNDPATDIGPMVNQRAADRIMHLVEQARNQGARLLLGGGSHKLGRSFLQPTIIKDVTPEMEIYHTEIFGPVVSIITLPDSMSDEEVLAMAEDVDAGLSAYVFSSSQTRLDHAARYLNVGMLGLNTADICRIHLPFGGVKQSGLGHEGGPHPLEDFLTNKAIVQQEAGS